MYPEGYEDDTFEFEMPGKQTICKAIRVSLEGVNYLIKLDQRPKLTDYHIVSWARSIIRKSTDGLHVSDGEAIIHFGDVWPIAVACWPRKAHWHASQKGLLILLLLPRLVLILEGCSSTLHTRGEGYLLIRLPH